ncbi:hypothetical protein QNM99_02805 [Pseudomonas sp. PCH446]
MRVEPTKNSHHETRVHHFRDSGPGFAGQIKTPTPLRSKIAGGVMLAKWFFIMMLDGKQTKALEAASEAQCELIGIKVIAINQEVGKKVTGACYVKASEERSKVGAAGN